MTAGRIRSHWRKSVANRAGLPLEDAITVMPVREVLDVRSALAVAIHTDLNRMARGLGHHSDLTVQGLINVRKGRTSVARIIAMPVREVHMDRRALAAAIHTDRSSMPRGLAHSSGLTAQRLIDVRRVRTSVARITAMPVREVLKGRRALAAVIHMDRNNMPRSLAHSSDLTVRGLIDVRRVRTSVARITEMSDREVLKGRRALAAVIHTDRNSMPRGLGHHSDLAVRGLIAVRRDRSATRHCIVLRRVVGHMVGECMEAVSPDVMNSHGIVRARTGRGTSGRVPDLVRVTSRLTSVVIPVGLKDTGLGRRVREGLAEERRRVAPVGVGLYRRSKVHMRVRPWGCLSMRTTTERSAKKRC